MKNVDSPRFELTFDDRQSSPLSLLPSGADQPALDFLNEERQILRVWFHDLIKLGKLPGTEEYFRQTKLEILVVKTQSFEESLEEKWKSIPVDYLPLELRTDPTE